MLIQRLKDSHDRFLRTLRSWKSRWGSKKGEGDLSGYYSTQNDWHYKFDPSAIFASGVNNRDLSLKATLFSVNLANFNQKNMKNRPEKDGQKSDEESKIETKMKRKGAKSKGFYLRKEIPPPKMSPFAALQNSNFRDSRFDLQKISSQEFREKVITTIKKNQKRLAESTHKKWGSASSQYSHTLISKVMGSIKMHYNAKQVSNMFKCSVIRKILRNCQTSQTKVLSRSEAENLLDYIVPRSVGWLRYVENCDGVVLRMNKKIDFREARSSVLAQ